MKFVINATRCNCEEKPCENAEIFEYEFHWLKIIKDENNKPILQQMISERKCWTIEINSLEDVMLLKKEMEKKYGDCFEGLIFLPDDHESCLPEIEIYNAWRE